MTAAGRPIAAPRATMRVLTVCEGIDAVLRMSAWLPELPEGAVRLDLSLVDALSLLSSAHSEPFDIVAFAPDADASAKRPAAEEFLALAHRYALRQVVLLAPGMKLGLTLPDGVEVLKGPPFGIADTAISETVNPLGWIKSLLARRRGTGEPAQTLPEVEAPKRHMIGFQGLAGGVGTTTLAAGLAHEIASSRPDLKVMLVDFNLQFASLAAYLSRAEDPRVIDLYTRLDALDADSLSACLQKISDNLTLFAAPSEMLPIDAIPANRLPRLLSHLRERADVIVIDLPTSFSEWVATIWSELDLVIGVANVDVRCQNNFRRLTNLSRGNLFRRDRSQIWINKIPRRPSQDQAEALAAFSKGYSDVPIVHLPDVGPAMTEVQALGLPLASDRRLEALKTALAEQVLRLGLPQKARNSAGGRDV